MITWDGDVFLLCTIHMGREMEDVYAFPEFIQHNSIATPPKQNTPFSKHVNAWLLCRGLHRMICQVKYDLNQSCKVLTPRLFCHKTLLLLSIRGITIPKGDFTVSTRCPLIKYIHLVCVSILHQKGQQDVSFWLAFCLAHVIVNSINCSNTQVNVQIYNVYVNGYLHICMCTCIHRDRDGGKNVHLGRKDMKPRYGNRRRESSVARCGAHCVVHISVIPAASGRQKQEYWEFYSSVDTQWAPIWVVGRNSPVCADEWV